MKQLREFEGDLNLIEELLGSREMRVNEKNYKMMFVWRGFTLWPTYDELRLAKGDLNRLTDICARKVPTSVKQSFRNRDPKSPNIKGFGLDF